LAHWSLLAASRAFCTAGSKSAMSDVMMPITTSNSTSVKPRREMRMSHLAFAIGKMRYAGSTIHCNAARSPNSTENRKSLETVLSAFLLIFILPSLGCGAKPAHEGKSVAELKTMLGGADATRRALAGYGLGKFGAEAKECVAELASALKDADLRVRLNAAVALGQIGPDAAAATPDLVEALKAPDATLRRQAAAALGFIGPAARAARPALEKATRDESSIVRKAAEESLKQIGK